MWTEPATCFPITNRNEVGKSQLNLGVSRLDLLLTPEGAMSGLYPQAPDAREVAFTDAARRLLAAAGAEAERIGHEYVGTEHVVLALAQSPDAAPLLTRLRVDREAVRSSLAAIVGAGPAAGPLGADRPYTSRARQAFGLAAECAAGCGHAEVGLAHLVVGLLRERMNLGAQVLQELGLSLAAAEAEAQRPSGDAVAS